MRANTVCRDYLTASNTVRGGGEKIRKYLLVAALVAAMVAVAPAVTAGGGNSKWGKGLLSETVLFLGDGASSGRLYWSPTTPAFVYDFHALYLEEDTLYTLVCFEEDAEPGTYLNLGSKYACEEDFAGVHIKGSIEWPCYDSYAAIYLVTDSWFSGADPILTPDHLIDI
jgi:hypothetical protein